MRNRICDDMAGEERWNPVLTFLFGALYFQYKINRAHEAAANNSGEVQVKSDDDNNGSVNF